MIEVPIKITVDISPGINKLLDVVSRTFGLPVGYLESRLQAASEHNSIKSRIKSAELLKTSDLPPAIQDEIWTVSLLARAQQTSATAAISQQRNLEAVFESASQVLPEKISSEPIDPSWIDEFGESARFAREEDARLLFAKILAGEIAQPGTFSKRALTFLRHLTTKEGETLVQWTARSAVLEGYRVIPFPDRHTDEEGLDLQRYGLSYQDFISAVDARILQPDDRTFYFVKGDPGKLELGTLGNSLVTFSNPLIRHYTGEVEGLAIRGLRLTPEASELTKIIEVGAHVQHFEALVAALHHRAMKVEGSIDK